MPSRVEKSAAKAARPGKPLLQALAGERLPIPPLWLMRQAGRYLPEYRALRQEAGSFLDLCYNPALAAEVTLQPLKRFDLDAAILFSDILVVPHALGRRLWFEEGAGPRLEPLLPGALPDFQPESLHRHLSPVYETVERVAAGLPAEASLIGFAGAPWTVASYMIEGGSSRDLQGARRWAYEQPQALADLIDLLVEATLAYLVQQVKAGAEVLQLFESWAGLWPETEARRYCLEPCRALIAGLRAACPGVPIILFPRGAGVLYEAYARECGASALGLDSTVPLSWAASVLQPLLPLQGNLDPLALLAGGRPLEQGVEAILANLGGGPLVFNLGHGVVPATPPEHVSRLVQLVRSG